MDELLPKATGKEARAEKKRMRAEKRREKEMSPGIPFCLEICFVTTKIIV